MTTTPRQSTATAARLTAASKRIGVSKRITAAALVAADTATRSLRAAAAHPLVRDISDERGMEDGVWIYLHDGWNCPAADANAIHEDSIADALACLKGAYYDAATLDEPEADALAAEAAEAAEADAPAAPAAKPEAPKPAADLRAAFRAAADRVLTDMDSNAARVEAERADRLEALEAPRRAAYAAEAREAAEAAEAAAVDADPVALRTAEVKQAAAAVRALSGVDATLATQAAVTAALHRAEAALDAARYCALEERCATGTAPLAETAAAHAELNDAARAHLSRAHADRKAYRLAGTGSAAQDAVNRAWNAAAAAEAVAHAAEAAHGWQSIEAAEAREAASRETLAAARARIAAARNARPGRVASVALAVFAFAVPVTLAAYALTPEPHRALAGALCGCLVGPALGIFLAARTAPPRAVAVEDARTAAHRARCHRNARAARNA